MSFPLHANLKVVTTTASLDVEDKNTNKSTNESEAFEELMGAFFEPLTSVQNNTEFASMDEAAVSGGSQTTADGSQFDVSVWESKHASASLEGADLLELGDTIASSLNFEGFGAQSLARTVAERPSAGDFQAPNAVGAADTVGRQIDAVKENSEPTKHENTLENIKPKVKVEGEKLISFQKGSEQSADHPSAIAASDTDTSVVKSFANEAENTSAKVISESGSQEIALPKALRNVKADLSQIVAATGTSVEQTAGDSLDIEILEVPTASTNSGNQTAQINASEDMASRVLQQTALLEERQSDGGEYRILASNSRQITQLSVAQVSAPSIAQTPQSFHQISAQISTAVDAGGGQDIEIRLDPEELGRVRIVLSSKEGGMSVLIVADRSDTLDLMRRNVNDLASSFADIGYESASFDFEREASHEDASETAELDDLYINTTNDAAELEPSVGKTTSTQLDMRL